MGQNHTDYPHLISYNYLQQNSSIGANIPIEQWRQRRVPSSACSFCPPKFGHRLPMASIGRIRWIIYTNPTLIEFELIGGLNFAPSNFKFLEGFLS
jgi:hypothetical protein